MLYSHPSSKIINQINEKGVEMLKNMTASALNSASFDALFSNASSNYPFTATKPKWFTNRDYAHFGNEASGVNG
jgi:hypothetical protein